MDILTKHHKYNISITDSLLMIGSTVLIKAGWDLLCKLDISTNFMLACQSHIS